MPSERKLNVSLSMKIKGESTFVKVLPWDPFATFNVAVLIHSFVHIGCAFAQRFYFFIRILFVPSARHKLYYLFFLYETFNDNSAFFKFESKTLFSI
jgi:hypothetical protein